MQRTSKPERGRRLPELRLTRESGHVEQSPRLGHPLGVAHGVGQNQPALVVRVVHLIGTGHTGSDRYSHKVAF